MAVTTTVTSAIEYMRVDDNLGGCIGGGEDYRTLSGDSYTNDYLLIRGWHGDNISKACKIVSCSLDNMQVRIRSTSNGATLYKFKLQYSVNVGYGTLTTDSNGNTNRVSVSSMTNGVVDSTQTIDNSSDWKTYSGLTYTPNEDIAATDAFIGLIIAMKKDSTLKTRGYVKNIKLTAVRTRACYITFTGKGVTETTTMYDYGSVPSYGSEPTRTGYKFAGWESSADGQVYTGTLPTAYEQDVTYTAQWGVATYDITATAGEGGTVTGGGTYEYGATATLKATANSGYKFVKWSDGVTTATRTVTVTGEASYTAVFEAIYYRLIFDFSDNCQSYGAGTVSGSRYEGISHAFVPGSVAYVVANPKEGYAFSHWEDGSTDNPRNITMSSDVTVKAYCIPVYVTYDSIFNFLKWEEKGVTSSRGAISDITDTGFTFTASIDDGYTDYSHMFAVEPGKTYTVEYDCSGGSSHESFVFFHNAEGDYSWTKLASSMATKWSFTVPDGFYLASVRFDVNTKDESITYSNIRIYPANCSYMGSTLAVDDRIDKAQWSMPTPTRDCYKFLGWNTKEDGSGKFYTASDAYPADHLVLYSIWQADPPKISDVQVIYGGKIVSSTNKVPAGQSYIVKCKLE